MIYNVDMFGIFVVLSKLINLIIESLKLGAGYTWPGHISLLLCPNILRSPKIRFSKGLILLSGTNGKTTTSKLITHIIRGSSFKVVSNASGANLKNGVVSSILLSAGLRGLETDYGVFEVDEFALPEVLEDLSPDVLILLNLSRDQLDRYGETDTILSRWKESLSKLDENTTLITDSEQKDILDICQSFSGKLSTFDADISHLKSSNIKGVFNAKNINAAILACKGIGISEDDILSALRTFKPAYGRGERIDYLRKTYQILLAKNPASFNYNLASIRSAEFDISTIFFVLNDNIPDGRDVSWIYDIDAESLREACEGKSIYVSGVRGVDMALRLKHAGVSFPEVNIFKDLRSAFDALSESGDPEVLVLPNYSAMLEVRDALLGRKIL